MKSKILFLLASVLLLLVSCEKVEQQPTNADKVVVEGYLKPDQKATISVTKEIAYNSNDSVETPIEGLEITLTNNDSSEVMVDKGLGVYESKMVIKESEKYSISFLYKGKQIKSETTIPEKPKNYSASKSSITIETFNPSSGAPPSFPQPIELSWTNDDNRYFLVVVENIENNPSPIFDSTRYELKMAFRNQPLQTNSYELNMRSFSYYGTHRIILFNLNAEYVSLYDNNGSSSLNLTTPPSNIEGGLGIFTGVSSDTLFLEVRD